MSNHDKAIEAACAERFGTQAWHASIGMHGKDAKHIEEHRRDMRRAIAAFLRAEATQLLAAYKARSIGGMLADELNSLAAELESDNA